MDGYAVPGEVVIIMHKPEIVHPKCPMCGKNSATRGDSAWGHTTLCCSDECGRTYAGSRQQAHREIARLVEERDIITQQIAMWERQLKTARTAQ